MYIYIINCQCLSMFLPDLRSLLQEIWWNELSYDLQNLLQDTDWFVLTLWDALIDPNTKASNLHVINYRTWFFLLLLLLQMTLFAGRIPLAWTVIQLTVAVSFLALITLLIHLWLVKLACTSVSRSNVVSNQEKPTAGSMVSTMDVLIITTWMMVVLEMQDTPTTMQVISMSYLIIILIEGSNYFYYVIFIFFHNIYLNG